MSTIDEHLATLEMLKANGENDGFYSEAYLFMQVHWAELIAERAPGAMSAARETIEQRIHDQLGAGAEQFIRKWHEVRAKEQP